MNTAEYYKLIYSDKNTDILTLYLSQMQASNRSRIAMQRAVQQQITRLETYIQRVRNNKEQAILEGKSTQHKWDVYKNLMKERAAINRTLSNIIGNEVKISVAEMQGKATKAGQKLRAAELQQKAKEEIEKSYTISGTAKGEIAQIVNNAAGTDFTLSNIKNLISSATQVDKLATQRQKEVYANELLESLLLQNQALGEPLTSEAIKTQIAIKVPTFSNRTELDSQKRREIKDAQRRLEAGTFGTGISRRELQRQRKQQQKTQRKLNADIEAARKALDVDPQTTMQVEALLRDSDLQGYLADVSQNNYQITGQYKNKDGELVEYDVDKGENARKALEVLQQEDPRLVGKEISLLLDKTGYVSMRAKQRALEQQNKFVGIDNSLQNVLRAPQIDLLTPIGQVKNYIKEMDGGVYKNRLMAQFEAESNPEFGKLYNSVPERERVLFAIQPNMWERYQELSGEKEGEAVAYGARKGLLKGRNKAVKQAAKYVQTMTPEAFKALRPNKMIDAAEELFKTKNDQAAFLTEIGALQRLAKEGTAIKTPTITDLILARAPEMQKKAEKEIEKSFLERVPFLGAKITEEKDAQRRRRDKRKNNTAAPEAAPAPAVQQTTQPKKEAAPAQKTHIVVKGDKLGSIARKHGVTVRAIKDKNNIKSNKISIGTKLVIPTAKE